MSETPQPSPSDPRPDDPPDQTTPDPDPTEASGAEPAPGPETARIESETRKGRRVTRRTVDRREVTEHTQETITDDIPLEAYQGPGSAHPAPVG